MHLRFEQDDETFVMEVNELDERTLKLPDQVFGFRCLNRIALGKRYFDDYIMALAIDDFETVRAIFEKVIDQFTLELPYKTGITHLSIVGDDESFPHEVSAKNLLSF